MPCLIFANPPFTLTWVLLTNPPPPIPPLSSSTHETKSMYLSSHHVQLIDILFKATFNLDSKCSSPRLCVDNCHIDIKVLGALNHFFFFSWLLFLFCFFVRVHFSKAGKLLPGHNHPKTFDEKRIGKLIKVKERVIEIEESLKEKLEKTSNMFQYAPHVNAKTKKRSQKENRRKAKRWKVSRKLPTYRKCESLFRMLLHLR